MMAKTASRNCPCSAKRIAVRPAHRAASVSTLGISRLMEKPRNPRRRRKSLSMAASALLGFDDAARLCRRRIEFGHDRLAANHALSGRDQQTRPGRQIEVGAAAEPDVAEALAGGHGLAGLDAADDAARHPARDLHAADQPAVGT